MFHPSDPGAGASNCPPAQSSLPPGDGERLRHIIYGSLPGLERTIQILHVLNYADPTHWSDPLPSGRPGEWMRVLTKILLLE